MPVVSGVTFRTDRVSAWAARSAQEESYLRRLRLAPCTSEAPERCLLRGSLGLPWGETPGAAIRALLSGVDPVDWPETVGLRLFDFSGPLADIDDEDAEEGLLSPSLPSPLWDEIRDSAAERQVGLIRLNQLSQLIVPVLALRASGGALEWSPHCCESILRPELAFQTERSRW